MSTREWVGETPWRKMAEIAKSVIRKCHKAHGQPNDSGLIYADTRDFETEFELPLKLIIAESELRVLLMRNQPTIHRKLEEINVILFKMAEKDYPGK